MGDNTETDRLVAEFIKKWGFSSAEMDADLEQDVRVLIGGVKAVRPVGESALLNVGGSRRITFEDV